MFRLKFKYCSGGHERTFLEIQIGKWSVGICFLKVKLFMYFFSSIHITRKGPILSRINRNPGAMVHMLYRQLNLHKFHASWGYIVRPCLKINGVMVEEKAQCFKSVFYSSQKTQVQFLIPMLGSSKPHVTPV